MSEDRHFYSWTDGFSTDDEWRPDAKLYSVTCNNLPQPDTLYCLSGPNGFVKRLVRTSGGQIKIANDNIVTEIVTGYVEVFRP